MKYYTTEQVAILTGATPRMLQWWDEKRVLSPEQRQRRRLYTDPQLRTVQRLMQLRKAGVSLKRARAVLNWKWTNVRRISGPTLMGDTVVVP